MWAGGRGGFAGPPSPFLTSLHLSESPDRPWNPPTFSPALLLVTEGDNATFTCSFSNASESFVLNWYRMSPSNQTDKLAAFPEDRSQPGRDCRFRVTQLPNGRDFHMSVVRARRNDSGTYLCGAISLAPKAQIKESLRAELRVTGAASEARGQGRAEPVLGWVSSPAQDHELQGRRAGTSRFQSRALFRTRGTLPASLSSRSGSTPVPLVCPHPCPDPPT